MRLLDVLRARGKLMLFRRASEQRMTEEIRFHIDMETDRLTRVEGLDAREARRRAQVMFGGEDRYREELREGRGTAWLSGMSLDFRLGLRMLLRYPGLTIVGTLALMFAVAVGAFGFEAIRQAAGPSLPFAEGDRIIAVRAFDAAQLDGRGLPGRAVDALRQSVTTLESIGAYRSVRRNVAAADDDLAPALIAEITPSAFAITGVRPVRGRPLLAADADPGAAHVVVIGEEMWRVRFGGNAGMIGRTIRIGAERVTVVGVMPAGFGFPHAHEAWVPLRPADSAGEFELFGRLAAGATLAQARAEVKGQLALLAAGDPETYEHMRIDVLPFTHPFTPMSATTLIRTVLYSSNLLFILFVALIAANVAALIFARTATRESEIVVRNALGASRRRIVLQLFAETLLLGMLAVPAGIALAAFALRWTMSVMHATGATLPFWITPSLSAGSVLFACLLAVVGCAVAGIVPGLRVTRRLGAQLRQIGAGGGGLRLGRGVTAAIVAQVAVTVIFVAFATYVVVRGGQIYTLDESFAANRYLGARLQMDRAAGGGTEEEWAAARARFRAAYEEVERRLATEAGIAGMTFASRLPGSYHERLTAEIDAGDSILVDRVQTAWVQPDFFTTLGSEIIAGRTFNDAELAEARPVAIVNASFVRDVLGSRNPIGRRVRYVLRGGARDAWSEWHEIIGVAADLPLTNDPELPHSGGLYLPLRANEISGVFAAVRASGADAGALSSRLREVAASVDPTVQVTDVMTLSEAARAEVPLYRFGMQVLVLASGLALLLSLAATYAVMSYAVSRRTREIGIRLALGARPHRVVAAAVGRHMVHAAAGVFIGVGMLVAAGGGIASWRVAGIVAAFVLVMLIIVLLSSVVPVRRALRVQPAQALKVE